MAEAGALVCIMLAATLFFQTLRFQTEGNFRMDERIRRRHLKPVSATVVCIIICYRSNYIHVKIFDLG